MSSVEPQVIGVETKEESGWTHYRQVDWNTTLGYGDYAVRTFERKKVKRADGRIVYGRWELIKEEIKESRTLEEAKWQDNFTYGDY